MSFLHSSWITEWVAKYDFLATHIISGPRSFSYFIPHLINIVALLIPPEIISHRALAALFVPVAVGCTVHAWIAIGGPDGASVCILLWIFHTIWFEDVRRDYKLLRIKEGPPQKLDDGTTKPPEIEAIAYPSSFPARLGWVINLMYSPRLSYWQTPSQSHTRRQRAALIGPKPSRATFARLLILEQLAVVTMLMPIVQLRRETLALPLTNLSWSTNLPLGARQTTRLIRAVVPAWFLQPLSMGLYLFSGVYMNFQHAVPLLVLSNFMFAIPSDAWSMHMQPPIFGKFSAVLDRGLAGLWGGWWHQFIRIAMSTPGKHLARKLGYADREPASYVLALLSAFFFSGVMHASIVPPKPLQATRPVWLLRLLVASFFWIQPVGIAIELVVALLLKKIFRRSHSPSGPPSFAVSMVLRTLRFIWVAAWLCATLPILELPLRETMCWQIWPFIFYPEWLRHVLSGEWLP